MATMQEFLTRNEYLTARNQLWDRFIEVCQERARNGEPDEQLPHTDEEMEEAFAWWCEEHPDMVSTYIEEPIEHA